MLLLLEWPGDFSGGNGTARLFLCARSLAGRSAYVMNGERRCLGCALRHRPLLRRSAWTALVVGAILVAINQGTVLATGSFPAALLWKIPLSYMVPFCVASCSAQSNAGG